MQTVIEECLRFHYVCQISSFICNLCSACIERCLRNYSSFALLRFIIRSKGDHHPWRSWGSQSGQDKEITGTIETNESLQVNLGQLINCRLSRFCPIFYHHIPSNYFWVSEDGKSLGPQLFTFLGSSRFNWSAYQLLPQVLWSLEFGSIKACFRSCVE